MRCPSCGQENRSDLTFCTSCGAKLEHICASCGAASHPGDRFCGRCGQPFGEAPAPPAPTASLGQPAASGAPQPTSPSAAPTSFAQGRYQVEKFLGEGGKKRVYLAHDSVLDRDVALAVIKTEGLDAASISRVTREAQALGRLGDHPHILQIFDLGREEGRGGFETRPYMVLPLMPGGDVEGLIAQAPDHRLPLEQTLTIAKQVCRGLEFAHAKGIVHRDLKPGNVWLTADGTAKIGDFGLALPLDRPRLTQEGMMVGTVAYMPPEQAMGGEVTPKADLYSLGCMLYEMVTGRPPFLGDDAVAIIGQHINTPPVAPTWHNGQCPRPLEALILRLLAKDPAERPQSARDVLAALEGIDATDVGAPLAAPSDQAHALDSLAGGVFVGRQREMGELKAALEDALSGRGRLVMLVGEPGIGKTRTAQELTTYAGLRQCQVLWGRCYEEQGMPPYWPWVQVIRSYVRERDPQQLRSEMGAGAADIAEVVSDVKERLPDLKPPPALDSPEQARFRLFDSITAFLKAASRQQPLVLVLDDLHWADKPSLLLLQFVSRELAGGRLLLVGAYRDMELSRQHPLAETLGELTRERLFQRVLLRGLGQEDVGRFIELAAGITPPAGLVEAVYRQTEGNPLFVTEVVRLLVQEGELTPDVGAAPRGRPGHPHRGAPTEPGRSPPQRESWTVRIPEGVKEVIGRRLNRLSQRCNQTLTIAAVIGREFELRQLARLVEDMSEDRLLEMLEEALAARVVEELPRIVGRYQFTHALIQETLSEELTLTRRVRLHARIAEALETLYGADAEAHAAELAHHFAEAQTVLGPEKLVRYSLVAGERALASYGWEEALAHFQRGLAAKEGQPHVGAGLALPSGSQGAASSAPAVQAIDAQAAALLFGLGRAQTVMVQREEAWDCLTRAFGYYAAVGDVPRVVAIGEHDIAPATRLPGMAQLVARALTLVRPDSHDAGRLWSRYAWVLGVAEGDYAAAQEAFGHALRIAQQEKDAALEARTLLYAAAVAANHLRWRECLDSHRRALALGADLTSYLSGYPAIGRWATAALTVVGDLPGARQQARAVLGMAEKMRHRDSLRTAFMDLAVLSCLEGDWQAARAFNDRGLAAVPQDWWLSAARALVEYEVGDFGAGQTFLEPVVGATGPAAERPTVFNADRALAMVLVARIGGIANLFQVAQAIAEKVLSSPSAVPLVVHLARTALALMAVQRGDAATAAEQYPVLEPQRGTMAFQGDIANDRVLGLLAQTMGQLDKATEHFEDALAFCRKAGYRPELAWSCCDYADCLLDPVGAALGGRPGHPHRGAPTPGDRAKAMALLDEALRISSELGMRPLMERVLSRREILQA